MVPVIFIILALTWGAVWIVMITASSITSNIPVAQLALIPNILCWISFVLATMLPWDALAWLALGALVILGTTTFFINILLIRSLRRQQLIRKIQDRFGTRME